MTKFSSTDRQTDQRQPRKKCKAPAPFQPGCIHSHLASSMTVPSIKRCRTTMTALE